jgi:hypothetical protein
VKLKIPASDFTGFTCHIPSVAHIAEFIVGLGTYTPDAAAVLIVGFLIPHHKK